MEYGRKTILQNALLLYGQNKQAEMAIEEMGELLVAMNHRKRGRVGVEAVQEEIADVKIAMDQLAIIYGEDGVSEFEKKKLARLKDRIIKDLKKKYQKKRKMDKEKEATNIKVLTNLLKELAASTDSQSATLSYVDSSGWCFSMTASNLKA